MELQIQSREPLPQIMLARYYSPAGTFRFSSVDPALRVDKNLAIPQRWNRYSYALNSPLNYLDPDGRDVEVPDNVRPAVVDAYQKSGTFREKFDSANSNHDIKVKIQLTDKVVGADADFEGTVKVKLIKVDPATGKETVDYEVEGTAHVPAAQGNQETGALIAHELEHAINQEANGPETKGTPAAEEGKKKADATQKSVEKEQQDPADDISKEQAEAAIPKEQKEK